MSLAKLGAGQNSRSADLNATGVRWHSIRMLGVIVIGPESAVERLAILRCTKGPPLLVSQLPFRLVGPLGPSQWCHA